ncbi:hypothetical protein FM037_09035 [Shewanella psychropiezotolerans]|uniref:PARP catalytic domain-containing protein n=1 Tax=Shewanella psychropiezotolerans TaxID=2593655 RepID=A0ABX5X234_9GAMM|nr:MULTISPECIES: hypothetical protein [Shewanella]MPY22319.1 hypothetical protein [Shewanella sp. YLB-07]QDO83346.1 hypothetical protein FM037_09035 [Shewanella psychropiezotolerans]
MQFIGYHGTSESSALNILKTGVRRECLPPTGQIGPGFYIAKMKGNLPEWGATQATAPARHHMWIWRTIVSRITGEYHNPFLPNNAKRTILKIYTTKPLQQCKWNSMNPVDFSVMNMMLNESEQGRHQALNDFFIHRSQWLQMVIPPEELKYLAVRRDDDITQKTTNWFSKESPM